MTRSLKVQFLGLPQGAVSKENSTVVRVKPLQRPVRLSKYVFVNVHAALVCVRNIIHIAALNTSQVSCSISKI